MTTINVSGKEYAATPSAQSFLRKYLERVRAYVASNGISSEYAQDIENRLAEKLAAVGGECAETDAVRIVNEIWEPEDAFAEAPKNQSAGLGDIANAVKNNMKSPLYRDSSKGMIFWVCAGLGDKFDVDPFFIRLLFVFLFFFYWTGVIAYLVLAILMKDRSKIENPEAFAEKRVEEGVRHVASALSSVPSKTSEAVLSLFRVFFRIVGFFFFSLLALFLAFASISFLTAFGVSMSGIVIENQNLFGWAHPALPYSAAAAGTAFFVLAWISGFRAFWKKLANAAVIIVSGVVLAWSVAAWAFWTFKTVANFAKRESVETVFTTEISTGTVNVDFWTDPSLARNSLTLPRWTEIRLAKSENGKVSVRAVTEVSARDSESAKGLFAVIAPVEISTTGSTVSVRNGEISYVSKGDYAFAKRVLEISVPENVRVKLLKMPRHADFEGVGRTVFDEYAPYDWKCSQSVMKYSPERSEFICDPMGYPASVIEEAKRSYLESRSYRESPEFSEPYGETGDAANNAYRVEITPSGEMVRQEAFPANATP